MIELATPNNTRGSWTSMTSTISRAGGRIGRWDGELRVSIETRVAGVPSAAFIDNLLVRIHFIIVMIRWTGLAPREFEFPFPGSLTSPFLITDGDRRVRW